MIDTIVGCADIHLRTLKKHHVHKAGFNNFVNEIKKVKPDRLVIAGDLLHNKITVSNEAFSILSKLLNALSKYTKIIIIPGNHDAVIGSDRLDSITPIIDMMNNSNIIYYKESGCYIDKWDNDTVWVVWSCLEDQKSPEIKEWKKNNDINNKTFIGLYHGVINGSTTAQGFTFVDEGVDTKEFYHTDFFLAGDIHKYQTYEYENYIDKGFGIMISTMLQDSFGEEVDNHGYVYLQRKKNEWVYELVDIENEYGYHTFKINSFEEHKTI